MQRSARPIRAARGGARAARVTWVGWGVAFVLVAWSFLQRPGRTTFDTKFDLTADPGRFLQHTFHLWNPWQNFGELQNQAYGYLFPQGAFFWVLDRAGAADWVAQRLWSALLLLAAYEGCRRLHAALVPGRPLLSILAGVAYATAPRLLGLSGVLSAEVLPTAVLPWMLTPLVLGLRGRWNPWLAGLASGGAALFMGGVNAVENLAVLPVAFLLVMRGVRTSRGRRLALAWAVGVGAASLWWFLPLLVMGRYSPPFLDYIETAAATTRPLGWTNIVRGADHWLAFVNVGGQPWWPGAYDLAVQPALIFLTAAVAAVSLVGLLGKGLPMRGTWIASAALGMALLSVGHAGFAHSPLDAWVRDLLDGPLAALRNVHKVDPLVRLPLALGFANAAAGAQRWLRARGQLPRWTTPVGAVVALTLLAASAAPLFSNSLRKPGWSEVPSPWYDAAAYLEGQGGGGSLVLPGTGFGMQLWGWTIDQPIQGVATTPWAMRSQVPLVPGPTLRFLDSIETRIDDGVGSGALAPTLAGAGVEWVVVRRDLDLYATEAPSPSRVDAALAASPGLELARSFGRYGPLGLPLIDVYHVEQPVPVADAPLRTDVLSAAGGPEDLLTAREVGVLRPGEHALFGGRPPDVVGDGYRRQERQFGRLQDSLGDVLTTSEPYRSSRPVHDYAPAEGQRPVVARYSGLERVVASSSAGYVDALGPIRPEVAPASAVDGDPRTYWQSAPLEDPVGQWLELDLGRPKPLRAVNILVGVDTISGAPVRRIRVDAGDQARVASVNPFTGRVRVPLDGTPVGRVRVTVEDVEGDPSEGVVAIREIGMPGFPVHRTLVVPDSGADASTSFVFRAQAPRRACVPTPLGPTCSVSDYRARLEQLAMRRDFTVHEPGRWRAGGTVTARATTEAMALLDPFGGGIRATASSTLANDLLVAPRFLVDGDLTTPWVADVNDTRPTVRLTWDQPRRLTGLRVSAPPGDYLRPVAAVVRSGGGVTRRVDLRDGGFAAFRPFTSSGVRVRFVPPASVTDRSTSLAVGELGLVGAEDLARPVRPGAPTGAPCGLGPEIVVDGRTYRTEISGTLQDLLAGTPLRWRSCDGPVSLSSGTHHVVVVSTVQYAADRLALRPAGIRPGGTSTRDVVRTSWTPTRQSYEVGGGAAAILRVPQNFNLGWVAETGGRTLQPVAVDGWQQGFEIPAGERASVVLRFAPDQWYRTGLLLGLLSASALVLALGTLAVLEWRSRRRRPTAPEPSPPAGRRRGRTQAATSTSLPRHLLGGAALALLALLAGGPAAAVGVAATTVTFAVARRARARAVVLLTGAVLVVVAGTLTAWRPVAPGIGPDAADALVGLAVGAMFATAVLRPVRRRRGA